MRAVLNKPNLTEIDKKLLAGLTKKHRKICLADGNLLLDSSRKKKRNLTKKLDEEDESNQEKR